MSLRLVFFGSDGFALVPLTKLVDGPHTIEMVVTRPDRPAGRGLKLVETPVSELATRLGITIFKPESLRVDDFSDECSNVEWDAGVVVAFGGLLPKWLLEKPRLGIVNLHPSLLPRNRGGAPVERALMDGASVTGVTTIAMNERLDAGPILMHAEEPIYADDTAGMLRDRLAVLGAKVLERTLDELERGDLEPVSQEEDKVTFAPLISTSEGNIDWNHSAERIDRLVRALNPEPGAYTFFRGRRIKMWRVRLTDVPQEDEPGTIMNMGKEGFFINTSTVCIQPLLLQPEGKQKMTAGEFSRGQRLEIGERFTSEP